MNEVVKKNLLAGYIPKVIPWMHVKHPRFPYSAWGTITKNKERIASNPKYYGYERGLAPMVYKFFDKKSAGQIIMKSMKNQ